METESITAPDAEEASMRELGIQTDQAQGREVEASQQEMTSARPEPDETPTPTETEVPSTDEAPDTEDVAAKQEPEQPPRDKNGQFQKRERTDTDYSRAVKEKARQDRSWSALQAEKEQFRQQQAQWEEQQRLAQLQAQTQQYQPLKKDGLTAQQYYDGAKVFERDGDHENALKAYKVASEMGRAEQQNYQQFEQANKEYQWRQQMQEVGKVAPQIWDANDPMHQTLARIIEQNPGIYNLPNGFKLAAEAAYYVTRESHMKELEDEIVSLKAELEKGRRKGQPARGGYAAPRTGEKDFDDLSLDEMEAHLRGITAEADNYR
jgi:hypothetical protein